MNKNVFAMSLIVPAVLSFTAMAKADFVTVLPTPAAYGPIEHDVSGAGGAVTASPVQDLVTDLSAESAGNPAQIYARATHILVESAFLVTSAELSRTSDGYATITGHVLFKANQDVFYSLAGQLSVTGSGTAGLSQIQSSLINYDTQAVLFDFDHSDTSDSSTYLDVIQAPGTTATDANGLLSANSTYLWNYQIRLDGNATATDISTATGDLALVFSWVAITQVPEPGTLGMLTLVAGGLLLRRRR